MAGEKRENTPIRTFVMLDLEATGLFHKPIKITEVAMVAAMREHINGFGNDISQRTLPRVLSKLNICVYPRKMISHSSTDVSGLSNELLEHQQPFNEDLFNILESFIKRLPQPVCMIAHNGIRFDFPLLQQEIQKIGKAFPDHILCADSLPGFRELLKSNKSKITSQAEVQTVTNGNNVPVTRNDKPIMNDLFKDVYPLENHCSFENKVTNVGVSKQSKHILESETSDFYADDYDEALYAVIDAVELCSNREPENNVEDLKQTPEKNTEFDTKTNLDPQDHVSILQKILEKTPENSNARRLFEENRPTGIDNKRIEKTPLSVNGKKNVKPIVNKARKKLNFSPQKQKNEPESFKLGDVYRFLLKKEPIDCHRAENDSLLLLECLVVMGEHFFEWADNNAVKFNSIKKMF